ncbi:MAG: transcriptional repressor [Chloroflexi bacterium]|nr:transcriptional repressor [Chloroflexota bacterium]
MSDHSPLASGNGQERTAQALKRCGFRITPQRMLVLAAMERQEGHFGAEDIYAEVSAQHPYISLSTIYRTIDLLERARLIVRFDGSDREEYHWAEKGHHHHLICQGCGAVQELEAGVADSFKEQLRQSYGFSPELSHMVIFGRCANCLRQKKGGLQ